MSFAVGSLVKTRGREWVVLPKSEDELLMLRPLGGTEDEVVGVYLPLEKVEPARFALPSPTDSGDFRSARLLRDAVRLGFRSSAGPFRSFARLGVEPRPYQLVPLLMALRLDPIRLLIADDVGIGKTVEAGLIAREMLDRGEVRRLAVLCPPPLAEQWQGELRDKFHIEAELVLPSTATRLERGARVGQSLFDLHPFVVVSTDFIKSERRLSEFARACPELVIVDEAHTCASAGEGRGGRHQRHRLIAGLAQNPDRHLILLSATPHSGNENAFRSLLAFLRPEFGALPEDLSGAQNEAQRRGLAAHFVQRRRADIRAYLQSDTPFPEREEKEETYRLSDGQKALFEKALRFARESVLVQESGSFSPGVARVRQRVRWWSALALLRSLASSPAAAVSTLRNRAANAEAETAEEADALGRRSILDLMDDETAEGVDVVPGSDTGEEGEKRGARRRLLEMAKEAEALLGKEDAKLQRLLPLVRGLVNDGYSPIVFCRYIPTAEYVAAALRDALRGVEVGAVTGTLPPSEREARVTALGEAPKRVLVCTDCLSEGINLQSSFDSIVHYDLSWNPTRHEQREGRVDRYGQPRKNIRVLTYYGTDNQIDGIVLDVLIRKHKAIRSSLGISVPVPIDSDAVVEAIFEGLLLRGAGGTTAANQLSLQFDDLMKQERDQFHQEWDNATAREKRSRTVFAQETIKPDEVAEELTAVRSAIGSGVEVADFTAQALRNVGGLVKTEGDALEADLTECPPAVREALGDRKSLKARFALPLRSGEVFLSRTHPLVENMASFVLDSALDPLAGDAFKVKPARCGVTRTDAVTTRTTLLLIRFRYHILTRRGTEETALLAEDLTTVAFEGAPASAVWQEDAQAARLLEARPTGNVPSDQAVTFLQRVIDSFDALTPHLEEVARERGEELLRAHKRVRTASRLSGVQYRVEAQLPPDVLALYVFLPGGLQ